MHFFCGGEECQHIGAAAGHHGQFQHITAQILHLLQSGKQFFPGRRFFKVVVGKHHLQLCAVGAVQQGGHGVLAGEQFHIQKVCAAGSDHGLVERTVGRSLHGMRAALGCSAESGQQGRFAQLTAQCTQALHNGGAVFHLGKTIHPPFSDVGGRSGDDICLAEYFRFICAGDGRCNFRFSGADGDAAHLNRIH